MGEVDAERARVGAHGLLLGEHGREVLGLLEDPQRDRLAGRRGRPGTGWYGEPFQHCPATLPVVAAGDQPLADLRGAASIDRPASRATSRSLLVLVHLAEQGPVDRDHPRRAVGDQRAALVVDDQPALRLDHDLAHRLRGGLRVVLGAADHLEVVEPREAGWRTARTPGPG